ncbi:MAG: sigma-70 family RNA polymerase sigma factor [Ginsengibacter sp.]
MPAKIILNEQLLLSKISEGDEKAFEISFKLIYTHLNDFVFRITESKQVTQEIVQDVYLKIWTNRSTLKDINSVKSYLTVIARNHTFNYLKKIASEKKKEKNWVDMVINEASHSISEESNDTNFRDFLDSAVELLPVQQKKVYILAFRNGLKQKQIAFELGISHETVKKHMLLAKRFLKKQLGNISVSIIFLSAFILYN